MQVELSINDLEYLTHSVVWDYRIKCEEALHVIPCSQWHRNIAVFNESMKIDDLQIKLLKALISAKAVSN